MAELLRVRILQRFDRHRGPGPRLPLNATLVHHRGLHSDGVGAQHGEVQQELSAEVVVVGFNTLLDLIGFTVEWNLERGKTNMFVLIIIRAVTQQQMEVQTPELA